MQEGTGSSWTGPHLSEVSCGVFQEHSEKLPSRSCSNVSSQINNLRIRTGPVARNMASGLGPNAEELVEANICDRGVGSEEESGVFIQRWTNNDTSSSPLLPPSSSSGPAEPEVCRDSGRTSIVDCLLVELYDAYGGRRNADSWDSSTEASGSDAFLGRSISGSGFLQELQERHTRRLQMNYLAQKDLQELRSIIQEVKYRSGLQSTKLIRQLKRRDRLHQRRQKNYDIITACLQAVSQKR
ncbi:hypothetical protein ILYODFUR_008630, partial [Ilyodon furcidens]